MVHTRVCIGVQVRGPLRAHGLHCRNLAGEDDGGEDHPCDSYHHGDGNGTGHCPDLRTTSGFEFPLFLR